MKFNTYIPVIHLQLFAEGGAAAGGAGDGGTAQGQGVTAAAALPQTKGAKSNPLANVKYGIQAEEAAAPAAEVQTKSEAPLDRNAEFDKLIKGEYKDIYQARMQDTIQKRLKGTKETVDKFNALTPTLELLGRKYGVDATDVEALAKAVEADDSYLEEEAMAMGMTVKQLKDFRKMERENADLRRQMQAQQSQQRAAQQYSTWMQQAEATKQVYPSFDLEAEMQNPQFVSLLRSNVDAKTAYEVIHKDEIIPAAMQFAAQTMEKNLTNKIIANGNRPAENGMSSQSASLTKSDVSQLTREDRREIARRVARGEKIRF